MTGRLKRIGRRGCPAVIIGGLALLSASASWGQPAAASNPAAAVLERHFQHEDTLYSMKDGSVATRAPSAALGAGRASQAPEGALKAPVTDVPWLEPLPDALVDPASVVAARGSLRLAMVAALQHLPARQRAVLILRDVLSWRASEVASLLGTSQAAVKSALQRARSRLEEIAPDENGLCPVNVSRDESFKIRDLFGRRSFSKTTVLDTGLFEELSTANPAEAMDDPRTETGFVDAWDCEAPAGFAFIDTSAIDLIGECGATHELPGIESCESEIWAGRISA